MKRTNRIVSLLLALLMLLPLFAVQINAEDEEQEGREMAVSHYFGNNEGDWETWGGNTNLVLSFNGVNTSALRSHIGSSSYGYEWYFTIGGTRYKIQPASEYTFSDSNMLCRFPTIAEGFFPVQDVEYSMFIEVYEQGERVYWGNIDDVVSRVYEPVVQGATYIRPGAYGSGMENWPGSPNGEQTQILFVVNDGDCGVDLKQLVKDKDNYIWTLHVADAEECFNLQVSPTTYYAFSNTNVIYRFEPCLADIPFVPVRDKTYHMGLTIRNSSGKVVYYSPCNGAGYTLEGLDPIVPTDLTKTVTWVVDGVTTTSPCVKGRTPEYPGGTPKKTADAQYTYEFAGWTPALGPITEDTTYTAVFNRAVNSYPVTFTVEGKSYTVYADYGETPVCPVVPEKQGDENTLYVFSGWSPALAPVTGAADYTAVFTPVSLEGQFRLAVEAGSAQIGRDVTVNVILRDPPAEGVYGYSFTLCYDPSLMTLQTRKVPVGYGYSAVKTAQGQVRFQWTDIETPIADGTVLGTATFRLTAAAAAEGGAPVRVQFISPYDSIYSIDTTGTALVDLDPLSVPAAAGVIPFISGDVNGDGVVNIGDVTALLATLADSGFAGSVPGMLDVTGEGNVNIQDVSRLLNYLNDASTPIYSDYDPLTHVITYSASYGGKVVGELTQEISVKGAGTAVEAVPVSQLYTFAYWSDGETDASRTDTLAADKAVEAVFVKKELELDIASIYIETENAAPIRSRDTYVNMTLSVSGSSNPEYNVSGYVGGIRGRGNSSWDYFQGTKPSYRIKFESKHPMLGVGNGADKDWILLTTYSDLAMLRNPLAWEWGRMFDGVPFATSWTFAHVYLNGEYRGLYILCDQVESGSSRIDIEDEVEQLDKGYLIEMDSRASGEGVQGLDWFNIVGGQKPFVIKSDVYSREECAYAQSLVQNLHNALMSADRERIEQVCYLDSLVDMYIIEEMTKDRDVGFASFYFYRDTGDKFYFAAPWDFDLGLGNDGAYPYTNGLVSTNGDGNIWFDTLIDHEWFCELVAKRLQEVEIYMQYSFEELDAYRVALAGAAAKNYERWNVLGTNTFLSPNEVARLKTFDAHVEYLISWASDRYDWLCGYFAPYLPD